MRLKIVLVRPVYPENIGLAARACANFECKELALVKPECGWKSGKAKSRAMHGKNVLMKAREYNSISEAAKDCTYSIATSARKGGKRNSLSPAEIAKRFGKSVAKIALVFGPEPSGLSNEEIAECDFIATIPASKSYGTLNLSHAVAVTLYELFKAKGVKKGFEDANPAVKKKMAGLFEKDLECLSGIDDKKAVLAAFKALSSRARVSEKEAKALTAFFSQTGKGLRQKS